MKGILRFLRNVTIGWLLAIIALIRRICAWCRRERTSERPSDRRNCHPISVPAFKRPDPLIYDQYRLMQLGFAVTWDNPDIQLSRGGVPVASSDLQPDTTYDVTARIWNGSPDAPVVALPVRFSYLDFGIGTVSKPIGLTTTTLGVKGGPNHPAFATVPWTTPHGPGHYCLQVRLEPVDDSDPGNNLGQENTQVGVAHSPAIFGFALENQTDRAHEYRFDVDAYTLGERPPCSDRPQDPAGRHRRGDHPVPAGWTVLVTPDSPALGPHSSTAIIASIDPPAGWSGRQPINVNAFDERGFVGGVTLTVTR